MKGIDMTERKAIFPANRHALYDKHGYSAAVLSGDLLFVSGQVGSLTDGSAEPDFEQQVRLAFKTWKLPSRLPDAPSTMSWTSRHSIPTHRTSLRL
jgi:hypothetical protein